MPLYKIENNKIQTIERTTFAQQNLRERDDLQQMLKQQIDIISPDTLVVAEEFGEWEDSRRRIDLLGVDKKANLVVIELKRTEDGGHMELQSVRYASMISTLTFDKLVPIYAQYLNENNVNLDAEASLLEFLDWSEPDEDNFAQRVRIVLASTDFSKELTTSVMWLRNHKIDISCVRMHPYISNGETYIDIQPIIPLPEIEDYQVKIREKNQKEQESREHARDFTKFDVLVAGETHLAQSKRWMMFYIISAILKAGKHPSEVAKFLPDRKFKEFAGLLSEKEVYETIMADDKGGTVPRSQRYFINEGEFFHVDDKTYILSNQWGKGTLEAVGHLSKYFPDLGIEIKPCG